jgi:branched-chain amino acid transport system permease protein
MSSKKSDILEQAPGIRPLSNGAAWWNMLRSNGPLPILLLLLIPLSLFIESRTFGAYNQRIVMLIGFNIVLAVSLQLINGFSGQFSLGHAGFMAVGAYLAAYPAINVSEKLTNPFMVILFFLALAIVVGIGCAVMYGLFVLLRLSRHLHTSLPAILLIVLLGWIITDVAKGSTHENPPIYFVWSNGLSFLQRMFTVIMLQSTQAMTAASNWLPVAARKPIAYLALLIGGGGCAAVAGLIVGLPTLRLRGDYLAIATLGMAEIIRIAIQNAQPLGGALGLTGIPKFTSFAWLYGVALITIIVLWRIAYSAKGRAIMAVRENEVAASAVGLDPTHHKVVAFVIGAFFGGVAGAMFALHERSITPSYFGFQKSIEIVAMVTLGGLGSISGAILAAIILTLLPEVLRPIAEYRMILYALLLISMMLLRPQGLLGGRELWPKRRTAAGREPVATEDRDDSQNTGVAPA